MIRKNNFAFMLIIICFATSTGCSFASDKDGPKISWLSFTDALALGKKEKRLVVIDFYTDWCKWCDVMDEKTYGNAEVIRFANKNIALAKVNAESDDKTTYKGNEYSYRQLAQAFGIKGYPATIFLDSEGDFITNISGYITADKFLPILKFLEGEHYKKMTFEDWQKKSSQSE